MKCSRITDNIEAYLGGNMSPRERKSFDSHLKDCEACRSELERCKSEDRLYRQALAQSRFKGTLRNIVLAKIQHQYKVVAEIATSRKKTAYWLAPVAAAAQFLIAFWLSGTLLFKPIPDTIEKDASGPVVSVSWVHDMKRFKYFSPSRLRAMPGPVHAERDMQVD